MDFLVQMAKDPGGETPAEAVAVAVAKCARPVMEPKLDGWRVVIVKRDGVARLYKPSRHKDKASIEYTAQVPELMAWLSHLPDGTILDGELVKQRYDAEAGRWINDFHGIQTAMASIVGGPKKLAQEAARNELQFVAFDAIRIDGVALDGLPMHERYRMLGLLLDGLGLTGRGIVQRVVQMEATAANYEDMTRLGMEGVVVKDAEAKYGFGKRGHGWFKIKATRTIDCVVTEVVMDGKGQHEGKAGKMVVGQFLNDELVPVARVNCLNNLQRAQATADPAQFVGRVIEVKIYGWDKDGPRHPTPLRFRDDKAATPEDCAHGRC